MRIKNTRVIEQLALVIKQLEGSDGSMVGELRGYNVEFLKVLYVNAFQVHSSEATNVHEYMTVVCKKFNQTLDNLFGPGIFQGADIDIFSLSIKENAWTIEDFPLIVKPYKGEPIKITVTLKEYGEIMSR